MFSILVFRIHFHSHFAFILCWFACKFYTIVFVLHLYMVFMLDWRIFGALKIFLICKHHAFQSISCFGQCFFFVCFQCYCCCSKEKSEYKTYIKYVFDSYAWLIWHDHWKYMLLFLSKKQEYLLENNPLKAIQSRHFCAWICTDSHGHYVRVFTIQHFIHI